MPDIHHRIEISAAAGAVYALVSSGHGFARWWAADVTAGADGPVELGFFRRATVYRLTPEELKPGSRRLAGGIRAGVGGDADPLRAGGARGEDPAPLHPRRLAGRDGLLLELQHHVGRARRGGQGRGSPLHRGRSFVLSYNPSKSWADRPRMTASLGGNP
jgi:hypothetical protein